VDYLVYADDTTIRCTTDEEISAKLTRCDEATTEYLLNTQWGQTDIIIKRGNKKLAKIKENLPAPLNRASVGKAGELPRIDINLSGNNNIATKKKIGKATWGVG